MKRALSIGLALVIVLAITGCRRAAQPPPEDMSNAPQPATAGGDAPAVPSAQEECGHDRRCRLARLRRIGRARAATRAAVAEAEHEAVESAVRRVEHDRIPRRRHPWVIENVFSDHWFGAMVGVHPLHNFFVGVGASFVFGIGHSEWSDDGNSSWVSANPLLAIQTEIRWLMFDHNVTPYVSGGFHVMLLGGMFVNATSDGGATWVNAYPALDVHAASIGLGIDVHLDFGLRFRAGAVLRPLIYVRAREGDMVVEVGEDGFAKAWRIFGAEGSLGWSW